MYKYNIRSALTACMKALVLLCSLWACHGRTFRIAWMAPGLNSGLEVNSYTSVAGLKLALSSVMSNHMILNGHNIEVQYITTDCTPHNSLQAAMNAKSTFDPDVIIGPPCQEGMRMVAQLCAYWNLPVFTWHTPGIEFDSISSYPTMVRMIPSLSSLAISLVHIMRQNNWTEFAFVYDDSAPWTLYEEALRLEVAHTEIHMLSSHDINRTVTDYEILRMFQHIKKYSWVIVFACPFQSIRRYMLMAEQAGMADGKFAFIQLDNTMYSENALNSLVLSNRRWKRGGIHDQTAKKAFNSLIHIMIDPMNDDGTPTLELPRNRYEEFTKMAEVELPKQNPAWTLPIGGKPDVYSLFLYDAVLVWSVLADKLQNAGRNPRDGKLMAMEAHTFVADGATGFIALNDNLDRVGKVFILYMDNMGRFRPEQILKFNATNGYDVINIIPLQEQFMHHGGQIDPPKQHLPPHAIARVIETPTVASTTTTTTTTTAPTTTIVRTSAPPTSAKTLPPTTSGQQTTGDVIKMLMARLHHLEKTIKEHELHAHNHIPDHTHTPHPLLFRLTSTSAPFIGNKLGQSHPPLMGNEFLMTGRNTDNKPTQLVDPARMISNPPVNNVNVNNINIQQQKMDTNNVNVNNIQPPHVSVTTSAPIYPQQINPTHAQIPHIADHQWRSHPPYPSMSQQYPQQIHRQSHQFTQHHTQESSQHTAEHNQTSHQSRQIVHYNQMQVPPSSMDTWGSSQHHFIPPPPQIPKITPPPTQPTTHAPTTAAPTTTTQAPTVRTTAGFSNNGAEQGQLDEAMINRISSRLVDHLTGVQTNSSQSSSQENQIVNDWLANGLEEIPLALVLAMRAERQRRLYQEQYRQKLLNNQKKNNQTPVTQAPAWRSTLYHDPLGAAFGIFDPIFPVTQYPSYLGFLWK